MHMYICVERDVEPLKIWRGQHLVLTVECICETTCMGMILVKGPLVCYLYR